MTPKAQNRLKQVLAVLACLLAVLGLRIFDPTLVSALRGAGFDTLQRIWPREMAEPQPVRIIDIDEASLTKLGQWPWSRFVLARMVDELHELGAAAISFDVVFPEPDRLSPRQILANPELATAFANMDANALPDSDVAFAAALSGRPTIAAFATASTEPPTHNLQVKSGFAQTGADATKAPPSLGRITSNVPSIDQAAAGIGGINIDLAGEQGVARQIPLLWSDGTRFAPSLSIETLRVAQGVDTILVVASEETDNAIEALRIGDIEMPVSETGMFYVHYRTNPKDLFVSAQTLFSPEQKEKIRPLIEGHIVYIGTSAVGLLDARTTALGETIPGVAIHAQATEQMLSGHFLTRPEWAVALELLGIATLGICVAAVGAIARPRWTFLAALASASIAIGATIIAFRNAGLLLDVTFPLLALGVTYLASATYRLAITDKDGRNLRRMFGQYVAHTVLAEIERNPEKLKLGGEVRDVTVMFVDIADFTPLSEKLSPQDLVQTVNGLWNVCTQAILAQHGTIDKFIGDAIMAFWNAPLSVENHQTKAALAALAIRDAVLAYNETQAVSELLRRENVPPLRVRIGLATGPACVGNMGSQDRFGYSVLGKTVNTAARTESTCKHVGHDILIAGDLQPATEQLAILKAGRATMKGKSKPETIHAVVGDADFAASPSFAELRREHDHLVGKLAAKPKPRALTALRQLLQEVALHHPVCATYLNRLADRLTDFVEPTRSRARG
jgi:adenylate cyclase